MGHGFKNKSKKTSYGSPFGPVAKLQIRAVGHAFEHNAMAWVENYRDTKLGSYSEEVARMGQDMRRRKPKNTPWRRNFTLLCLSGHLRFNR